MVSALAISLSLSCGTGHDVDRFGKHQGTGGGSADAGPDSGVGGTGFDSSYPAVENRVDLNFNLDWKYIQGDVTSAEGPAFDDSTWGYVDLPHTTKFVTPESPNAYLGVSWYRKHFTVKSEYRGSKVFIEFEAAMQAADVWINGVHAALHQGGYAPFAIDVTSELDFGHDNTIAVKVDSRANGGWAPGWSGVDFQYHGGLYRNVKLHVMNLLHVTDPIFANKTAGGGVFVTYPAVTADSATVSVNTNVINESSTAKSASVFSDLVDKAGQIVGSAMATQAIDPGDSADFAQTLEVSNPSLWHPNTPQLYTLRTTIKDGSTTVDDTATAIGIRRIAWSHDGGLTINGNRFNTIGVNMHQEMYGLGNAVPESAIYYDVKRIKDAGLNFIRGSHYPHAKAFYDACDALGILVLNAQTGWQNYNDSSTFKDNTFQDLRDMIRRDRNHPSVVAWEASLNESNFTDAWAQKADSIVHEEYPGDQAYSAAWLFTYADIFIDASQHGVRSSLDTRPIIIDEYGDWDYGGASSTSRQAREAGDIAMLTQATNVEDGTSKNLGVSWYSIGSYWDYADYAGFSDYGITRCGIVDMYRLPKFAYYFLQSQRDPNIIMDGVDSGPMVFIANLWTPTSPTTVRVYSNCDQVSLYLNDALFGTSSPDSGTNLLGPPFNFTLGNFTPGILRADCLIGSIKMASFERRTPGPAAALRLRPESTALDADLSDARLVFIEVIDANGTVVSTDSSQVTLTVSGPGSIVGPNPVTMKGGQLATWIRAGRVPGTISITANAAGVTSATSQLVSTEVAGLPTAPADR